VVNIPVPGQMVVITIIIPAGELGLAPLAVGAKEKVWKNG
jgi:hypothetical protein